MARSHYVGVVQGRVEESSGAGVVIGVPNRPRSVDATLLRALEWVIMGPWACSDSAGAGSALSHS